MTWFDLLLVAVGFSPAVLYLIVVEWPADSRVFDFYDWLRR